MAKDVRGGKKTSGQLFKDSLRILGDTPVTGARRPLFVSIHMSAMNAAISPGVDESGSLGLNGDEALDMCYGCGADQNVSYSNHTLPVHLLYIYSFISQLPSRYLSFLSHILYTDDSHVCICMYVVCRWCCWMSRTSIPRWRRRGRGGWWRRWCTTSC